MARDGESEDLIGEHVRRTRDPHVKQFEKAGDPELNRSFLHDLLDECGRPASPNALSIDELISQFGYRHP